jgi:hypothetical protein
MGDKSDALRAGQIPKRIPVVAENRKERVIPWNSINAKTGPLFRRRD